jgi:uncharacterized protein involved in exopolysaccharide biosynthesis
VAPSASEFQRQGSSHTRWWRVLSEQRWFILVFVLAALGTSLGLTYVYGEKYESSTAISYRTQEVTRFKAQQNEAMGSPAPQAPFKVIGTTLLEVLKSDAVLREVVLELRLDEKAPKTVPDTWYKAWYQAAKEWAREYGRSAWQLLKYGRLIQDEPVASAIEELRGNIKVVNRDSYIFNLSVRDRDPQRAARIVDHLSKVLADWLLDYDRQPGRYRAEQLRALLDKKGEELAGRRQEIAALLTENRVVSVQQDGEKLTEHLFSLQIESSRLASEIARARSRLEAVEAKLQLKRRILAQVQLGDAAPGAAPPAAVSSDGVEQIPPEDFKKLASERVFIDLEHKSLVAKHASLQLAVDDLASRLRKSPAVQSRYDALKLSQVSIEREYVMLNDAYQEAAVRATSPVSEVRVLHPALVPAAPASPIKVYHVLLAVCLGLPLVIGLVYLLDFLGLTMFLAPPRGQPGGASAVAVEQPPLAPPAARPAPAGEPAAGGGPAAGEAGHA